MSLDTAYRVSTPEGVELSLRLAGPLPRALAWLIDFAWRFAVFILLATMLPFLGRFGAGLMYLAFFVLEWLVPAACETLFDGATPGKKALGLAVLMDDGTPISWGPALVRNVLRFADFLPLLYLGGLISMLFNAQFKRLGDLAAGTVVVYVGKPERARSIEIAEALPARVALSLDEKRAVLDFAERAPQLTVERAEELAAMAGNLVGPASGLTPARQLIGLANHLVGRREGIEAARAPG